MSGHACTYSSTDSSRTNSSSETLRSPGLPLEHPSVGGSRVKPLYWLQSRWVMPHASWRKSHRSEELGCAFNKVYFKNLYCCKGEKGPGVSGREVSRDLLQNSWNNFELDV